jgi:hypothetical protein
MRRTPTDLRQPPPQDGTSLHRHENKENAMRTRNCLTIVVGAVLATGIVACEEKGPVEQAAEEVDEAVDTIKNDGKEPASAKIDDAVDELRE